MSLQAYKTLVTLAEIGSFSRTAARLNSTLSTVSSQMKSLEHTLGVTLFDRSVRPPRLTPIGRRIAAHCAGIVAAQDALMTELRSGETLRGLYRIGFIATASVRLLPAFLARARNRAPKAELQVETGLSEALVQGVATGRLDAAVITRSGKDRQGVSYTPLREEPLVYALPDGYRGDALRDCAAALPFIQFMPESGIGRLIAERIEAEGPAPRDVMILDSVEAILECVNTGIGYTLLPRPDVERYAHPGVARLEVGSLRREIALVTAAGSAADTQAKAIHALFGD